MKVIEMMCCNDKILSRRLPGSESAPAPEPPTPHLDQASGGPPAQEGGVGSNSERRASVTVSGSGGLTGLIQSALNQVFASSWTGSPGGSSSSSSSDSRPPSDSSNQPTTSSGQSSSSSSGQSSSSQQTRSPPESQEDEGTPATRRPRLDSEFVDLDFD